MTLSDIAEDELLAGIVSWTRIGSATYNVKGVNRMMDQAAFDAARSGLSIERLPSMHHNDAMSKLPLDQPLGDTILARLPTADGATQGGILVLGHLDTIQCGETLADEIAVSYEGDKIFGTGIYDMKGGMRAALHGLSIGLKKNRRPILPVTFLFVPDEEIGSPTSRQLIEREAKLQKYVLVPEPSHDGGAISGRHGFQRYILTVTGAPAHAGIDNQKGVSAIRATAHLIEEIELLNNYDIGETYSVGAVRGGLFVNTIPTACRIEVLCVAPTAESFERIKTNMAAFAGMRPEGTVVDVQLGPDRPLFESNQKTHNLAEQAKSIAASIGIDLTHGQFGGGSDGNFTGALGIPTLDGLGVDGAALHTPGEYMLKSTATKKCFILSELMMTLY